MSAVTTSGSYVCNATPWGWHHQSDERSRRDSRPSLYPRQPQSSLGAMDPVSFAASLVAFGQAIMMIPKIIETLRSISHLSDELAALINELSTLQAIHLSVQDCIETIRGTGTFPQVYLSDSPLLHVASQNLLDLIADLQRVAAKCAGNIGERNLYHPHRLRLMWHSREFKLLRDKSRDICTHLNLALNTLLLLTQSTQTTLLLEVHSIAATSVVPAVRSIQDSESTATSSQSSTLVAGHAVTANEARELKETPAIGPESLGPSTYGLPDLSHPLQSPEAQSHKSKNFFVEVETSVLCRSRCPPSCHCQCHTRGRERRWGWQALGQFFLHYNSLPFPRKPRCDVGGCRRTRSKVRLIYFFPSWAWNRAIEIAVSAGSILGEGCSLYIRVPRVVPVKLAGAWAAAFGGDLEVLKTWLLKHKYTPFDLQEDGASLLLHAIRGGQKNSVKLLVGYWGGRRVKCDNLTAYHALLSYETSDSHNVDPEDPYLQSLKGIVSSWQDDHDELEPELHRMIRLNSDISQILADDNGSRRLHRCDAWQRTPLALACQIGNVAAARLLIQYQPSNINKSDVLGRTPLMWAVRHDSHETLQSLTDLLLSANCDANLKDKFGLPALYFVLQQRLDNRLLPVLSRLITKTDVRSYNSAPYFEPFHQNPLHWMACSNKTTDAVTERITNMLLDSGARLDAQDARGHVPLQRAIARNNQITVRALTNACRRSVDPPAIDGTAVLYVAATHAKAEILRQLSNADVLWAKMSVKSLDDGEQSPVKTFNRRITTSVELLGGLLRPTVDDVAAFRALVEGIRYRDLPADQQTVGNG